MHARLFPNLFFLLPFFSLLGAPVWGQKSSNECLRKKITPDKRLYDVFSTSHIDSLMQFDTEYVLYLNYFLQHSYTVEPIKSGEPLRSDSIDVLIAQNPSLNIEEEKKKFENFKESEFNPLKFMQKLDEDNFQNYKLPSIDRLLIFYSQDVFIKSYRIHFQKITQQCYSLKKNNPIRKLKIIYEQRL